MSREFGCQTQGHLVLHIHFVYMDMSFSVGASVFAWVFLVARDLAKKTLTPTNENQSQTEN